MDKRIIINKLIAAASVSHNIEELSDAVKSILNLTNGGWTSSHDALVNKIAMKYLPVNIQDINLDEITSDDYMSAINDVDEYLENMLGYTLRPIGDEPQKNEKQKLRKLSAAIVDYYQRLGHLTKPKLMKILQNNGFVGNIKNVRPLNNMLSVYF